MEHEQRAHLILASASPRRRELMKLITPDFTAVSTDIDETFPNGMSFIDYPEYIANKKADAAMEKFKYDGVYIGCDTSVITEDEILFKPKDKEDAVRMLKKLSGKTHKVATGVCIKDSLTGAKNSFTEFTSVEFYPLCESEIEEYVNSGEPMDKAGAYGIQERGGLLVKRVDGDVFNVIGLPVARLARQLKEFLAKLDCITEFCN